MNFRWVISFSKILLVALVVSIIASAVLIGIAFNDSDKIINDRLADLCQIVADENCLDKGSGRYQSFMDFLEESETVFLSFDANSVYVGNDTHSKTYFSYVDAPQRGEPITCELTATVSVRLFIPGTPTIQRPVKVSYNVLGLKFYKDK